MKEIYKKPAQLTLTLIISGIMTFGIVFAQPLCWGTIIDCCLPAFIKTQSDNELSIKCSASLSNRRNTQLHAMVTPVILHTCYNGNVTCCENEPCDGFIKTNCFNSSPPQNPKLPVKKVGFVYANSCFNINLNKKSQPIPLHLTSIYILTKSIICWFTPSFERLTFSIISCLFYINWFIQPAIAPLNISYKFSKKFTLAMFGFIFLFAVIITGAVWANFVWGRYWGWDLTP